MKVKIEFTVEIDPEAWAREYGTEGATAIREDVKEYCYHTIQNQLAEVGVRKDQS